MKKQRPSLYHSKKGSFSNKKVVIVKKETGERKAIVPKKNRDTETRALYVKLRTDFPEMFDAGRPMPLDTRMPKLIRQQYGDDFSWKAIRFFLYGWTKRRNYLVAITKEPHRFNLQREATQKVLSDQIEYAKGKLKEIKRS